jgi:hypothetical protein
VDLFLKNQRVFFQPGAGRVARRKNVRCFVADLMVFSCFGFQKVRQDLEDEKAGKGCLRC